MDSSRGSAARRAVDGGFRGGADRDNETIEAVLWRTGGGVDRRSADPLNELGRRLDSICVLAVHPLEIAAALEAEGISDRIAQARYGHPDVFSVAEELFRRVPRRSRDGGPTTEGGPGHFVARSLAFILPSGLLLGLSRELNLGDLLGIMVLALLVPWSGMQIVGYLDTRLRGRGQDASASRLVANGSSLLVAVVTVGGAVLGAGGGLAGTAAVIGFGQSLYFVSATVLLSRGREWRLVAMVAPAAITLVVVDPTRPVTFAILAGVVVAVAFTAFAAVAEEWVPGQAPAVTRAEVGAAVGHGSVGLVWAGASLLGLFTAPSLATIVVAALPVTATLGFAEHQIVRFNERMAGLLERRIDRNGFRSIALVEVILALTPYVLALGATAGLGVSVTSRLGHEVDTATIAAYGLLGIGFFGGLLITTRHHPAMALAASLPAMVVFVAVGGMDGGHISPGRYLAATATFALGLMTTAVLRSSHPLDHRAVLR